MLGTTKSPREIPRDLQKFNKRPTGHILLWTAGQEIADRILATMREQLKPFLVRRSGLWYDEVPHENAITAVRDIARRWKVWVASTDERNQMLEEACTRAIEAHKQRELTGTKGVVVPLTPRR